MKIWKRVLGLTLAAVMVLGLGACNKDGGLGIGGKEEGGKEAGGGSSIAKEGVYALEEYDFSQAELGTDGSILKVLKTEDKLYLVTMSYDENWKAEYHLVSMNEDGSAMQKYVLGTEREQDAEGVSEETQEPDDVAASQEQTEETVSNVYENTNFGNFMYDDGRLYANKTYYFEDYSDPDNYVVTNENSICCWDMEGNLIWETPVELLSQEGSWYYITSIAMLSNGNVVLLINGDDCGKIEIYADGTVSDLQQTETLKKYMVNLSYTAMMPDGRLMLTYYDDSWSQMYVISYDFDTDTVNAPFPVPSSMSYNGLGNMCVDEAGDILYSSSDGIYKYHIGDSAPTQLMSFVNSDMTITYFDSFVPLNEEQFVGLYSEWDDVTYTRSIKGGVFTRVKPEDIPDKETLVLGGTYLSTDLKKKVVAFNKSSNTHRILLKDYSQYNSNEDYMAGYTQLNNDIIAGNMPDMLLVDPYNMSIENYVSKGLLADIGEMIDKDPELSAVEYMENVFEAASIDGKLYEVIPAFYVSTYVGKTSIVGDRTGWTMEEAQALLADMPEGTSLFGDMIQDSYMNIVMEQCGSDFVDISTGKCNFDSQEFISLMEFAKTLPKEMADDYYEGDWYINYESQYREDRTILSNCYISSLENMVYTINGSFGEEVSYVGMPTSSGQGAVIYIPTSYVISAKSEHQDVAWEFLRSYLTPEYQETLSWQLPIAKEQFDEVAQKATKKPVYKDADGNEVEEDYTYWLNEESIVLDPLTQEQVDEITAYISGITTKAYYNTEVTKIISEEMPAFYEGQKSAQEVAGIIQSRVQIYVNENR